MQREPGSWLPPPVISQPPEELWFLMQGEPDAPPKTNWVRKLRS